MHEKNTPSCMNNKEYLKVLDKLERLIYHCTLVSATLVGLVSLLPNVQQTFYLKASLLAFLASITAGICFAIANYNTHHRLAIGEQIKSFGWHNFFANMSAIATLAGLVLLALNVL